MSTDDPDFPEKLRMGPPLPPPDGANSLQRSMSMVSLDENTQEKPPTQVMSVSDDELESANGDWADQMQQDSNDRKLAEGTFHFRWLNIDWVSF